MSLPIITPSTSASALAALLVKPDSGITIVPATETLTMWASSSVSQAAIFSGGTNVGRLPGYSGLPFDEGVLLSTGLVTDAEGPNDIPDCSTQIALHYPPWGGDLYGNPASGDSDVTTAAGAQSYDACALAFSFVSTGDTVTLQYVFASEEYSEFVFTPYNDTFLILLNGVNIALIPGTTTPVSINTVNENTGFHPEYFTYNGGSGLELQADGLVGQRTPIFATAPVVAGAVNTLKIVIADVADAAYDSWLFVSAYSLAASSPNFRIVESCEMITRIDDDGRVTTRGTGNVCVVTPELGPPATPTRYPGGTLTICGTVYTLNGSGTTTTPVTPQLGLCPLVLKDSSGAVVYSNFIYTPDWFMDDPNILAVFSVGFGDQALGEDIVVGAWSIWTGPISTARCAVPFSATIGAAMSRDLKPYVGYSTVTNQLGKTDSLTQDITTNYQAYITTKAYAPWGPGGSGSITGAVITAGVASGVAIQVSSVRDFGLETRSDTATITAAASETRTRQRVGGAMTIAGAQTVQFTIGDAEAANNSWQLDSVAVTWAREAAIAG